jgi:acetyltransferase-like isoleucine patch superfamily enzyme
MISWDVTIWNTDCHSILSIEDLQNATPKNVGQSLQIGEHCWIGKGASILKNVTLPNNTIVGMGAVVTKDVPPYAIVAGVPAKVIKYRFDQETVKQLLELKWWNLNVDEIKNIPYDNINDAIKYLKEIQ